MEYVNLFSGVKTKSWKFNKFDNLTKICTRQTKNKKQKQQ